MLTPSTTDGKPPLFSVSTTLRYGPGFPPDATCAALAVPPLKDENEVIVQSVFAKVLSETVTASAKVWQQSKAPPTQSSPVRNNACRTTLSESTMTAILPNPFRRLTVSRCTGRINVAICYRPGVVPQRCRVCGAAGKVAGQAGDLQAIAS